MRIAVAYRFNGEDPVLVTSVLGRVCASLREAGHDVFCAREHEALFRERGHTNEWIYSWCLERFRTCDAILIFLRSDARSKGIELEIADAQLTGKPIFVVTPRDVRVYREHAHAILEYDGLADACAKLRTWQPVISSRLS